MIFKSSRSDSFENRCINVALTQWAIGDMAGFIL